MTQTAVPAWRKLLDAAEALTAKGAAPFTRAELIATVRAVDPSRQRPSLDPVIQGMTEDAPGGPPAACGIVFRRVARGEYVLIGRDRVEGGQQAPIPAGVRSGRQGSPVVVEDRVAGPIAG